MNTSTVTLYNIRLNQQVLRCSRRRRRRDLFVVYIQRRSSHTSISRLVLSEHDGDFLGIIHDFACNCKACNANSKFAHDSDARRKNMCHFFCRIRGCKVPDFSVPKVGQDNDSSTLVVSEAVADPDGPLNRYSIEAVQHQHKLGQLLEEEGLSGTLMVGWSVVMKRRNPSSNTWTYGSGLGPRYQIHM